MSRRMGVFFQFLAVVAIAVMAAGCSSTVDAPADDPSTGKQGEISKFTDMASSDLFVFDPATGKLSKDFATLRFSDIVRIAILGDGKRDMTTVRNARLAGAAPLKGGPQLVFDDSSGSETVQLKDANGDGIEDVILSFPARRMLPPSDANRFSVEIEGINAITIWDYERAANVPWAGSYWPTVICARRDVDHHIIVDASTGVFYPNKIQVKDGEVVGISVYDHTMAHGCSIDLSTASLFGLPEVGWEFYDKGNKAAGLTERKHRDHFMDYTDDSCFGPTVHFDVSPLFDKGGKGEDGVLKFSVGKTTYEFFTNYRPQALGIISMSLGASK